MSAFLMHFLLRWGGGLRDGKFFLVGRKTCMKKRD
jgi:hypothetical protein